MRTLNCGVVFLCGALLCGCADTLLIDDAMYVAQGESSDLSFDDPRLDSVAEEPSVWPNADTVEAEALLGLLHHPLSDMEVLDRSVGIDVRSATHLIEHRNGPDGLHGTDDDRPFTSVQQVDEIKGVGLATLESLVYYALDHGFPDGPFSVTLDDVWMSEEEAWAVVDFANTADLDTLDHEAGLDRRAVSGIAAARPLSTPGGLAAVPYIGPASWRDLLKALDSDDATFD